jgi:hypothetical protein
MQKIVADTAEYILDLTPTNTANYAEEDVVVLIKETCKDFYLPPMEKIKGNPTIYFFFDTILPNMQMNLHFTGGDYFAIDTAVVPEGKVFTIPIRYNSPETIIGQRLGALKPIIGGVWFFYTYA